VLLVFALSMVIMFPANGTFGPDVLIAQPNRLLLLVYGRRLMMPNLAGDPGAQTRRLGPDVWNVLSTRWNRPFLTGPWIPTACTLSPRVPERRRALGRAYPALPTVEDRGHRRPERGGKDNNNAPGSPVKSTVVGTGRARGRLKDSPSRHGTCTFRKNLNQFPFHGRILRLSSRTESVDVTDTKRNPT
jgi:hypothetical protein